MITVDAQREVLLRPRLIEPDEVTRAPGPLNSIVIKLASRCNLGCTYCYWFRDNQVRASPARLTPDAEQAFLTRLADHVRRHRLEKFVIGLHGGEPLLFGIARFHAMVGALRRIEADTGCELEIHLTTNAVLVDDDWAAILRHHRVLVGVSLDGPPELHDARRVDLLGRPTHDRVLAGLTTLRAWGLTPGVLVVCDPSSDPARLISHLVDELGVRSFDVLVPDARHGDDPPSIAAYYERLFDLWFDSYAAAGVRIRFLEAAVRGLFGVSAGVDSIGYGPITIVTLTTDGSVEVQDVCRIAGDGANASPVSILTHDLDDMQRDPRWREVHHASTHLAAPCRSCPWQYACGGGHIASRWSATRGFDNPSVYCADYQRLFAHLNRRVSQSLYAEPAAGGFAAERRRHGRPRAPGGSVTTTTAAVAQFRMAAPDAAPFPHLVVPRWLEPAQADAILGWFETEAVWQRQERSFYTQHSCFNADDLRTGPLAFLLEPDTLDALSVQLHRHFGADLDASYVHVEAHRLLPGEGIGLHNDNPVLGTEAVRVVAHFNRGHQDRHGGHLVLFASEDPADIAKVIRPLHNSAVSFPLGAESFHAVTDVSDGVRYSLVLGFFERGKLPAMRRMVLEPDGAEAAALARAVPDLASVVAAVTRWGAADQPHGDGTLLEHYLAVAGLLARWGAPSEVCRAGLAHSAYGTRTTSRPLRDERDRGAVAALLGAPAERLVWAYCRSRFGEVYRADGEETYAALTQDGDDLALAVDDVVALNLMAWANRLAGGAEVEADYHSWVEFCEVFGKLSSQLPARCVADLEPLTRLDTR